jgi:hypothetical protein
MKDKCESYQATIACSEEKILALQETVNQVNSVAYRIKINSQADLEKLNFQLARLKSELDRKEVELHRRSANIKSLDTDNHVLRN